MLKHKIICEILAFTAISFVLAISPVSAKSTKTTKIFLLCGQSNMVGAGKAAKLEPPYNKPFPKIKIWNSTTKKWSQLSPEVANKNGRFGPEISFAHAIAETFPDEDIRLVKYAIGGTSLYKDWSRTAKGRQYLEFMNTVKAAWAELDASGTNYEVAGMMWLQGENDAIENKAETYENNLTEFIAVMRTQFETPKMPFIIARVRNYLGGKTGQAKIVRDAQVKIAGAVKYVGWFDTDDCSMLDASHYDAAGLIEIGKRFAEKYKEIASKAKKR